MISISWKCHVWGKRIIWERHTKQKQSYVMGKEFWGKKKNIYIFGNWSSLPCWKRYLHVHFLLENTFSDQLQGSVISIFLMENRACLFFWENFRFHLCEEYNLCWRTAPMGQPASPIRGSHPNTQQPCAVPGNLPGHTAAPPYPQPVPGSLLWRMDGVGNKRWQEGYEEQEE